MQIYYIVTYNRAKGAMRVTKGFICESNMIEMQASLAKPVDRDFRSDPWIVAEIEPVDVVD